MGSGPHPRARGGGPEILLSPSHTGRDALRLAFRLALLDAVPADAGMAERCVALNAARDRLAAALPVPGPAEGLPEVLRGLEERVVLAAALQGGFDDAWAIVTQFPCC